MSNDLWEIKQKILNDRRVEELLSAMECQRIRCASNRYEAQLPDKYNSSNPRSVQVYLTEWMQCRIRSKGISDIDIFGLVSIIVFDVEHNESSLKANIYKSKKWICNTLGYADFISNNREFQTVKDDPLKWLKDLKKKRNKQQLREFSENRVYPDSILNQYIMYPYYPYIQEGLDYQTQLDFQVGFDIYSDRVIYPIYNQFGDIISIKGRTIDPDYKEKGIYKFLYLYNFNKMIEVYNWHNALEHVLSSKEIIIYEAEKSCWYSTQFGIPNCVAISGDDLSEYQVKMIKDLGIDVRIVLAMDKDKSVDDIKKQGKKFGLSRQVYALYDAHNLLSEELKESPTDKGQKTFLKLYSDYPKYRIT
ncbi:DNA primase [Paenibacillus sp. GCM10027627]|uniref:DNA primase n=1 Tax=unclassified Paenibacillus TaxID=185978 RepID=UPI00362C68FA